MIKYKFAFLTLLLVALQITITAQQSIYPQSSPEWLVDMFFKQENFQDKIEFLTGEMRQDAQYPTIGEELKGGANVLFRKVKLKTNSALYAIDITGNGSNAIFYCYLIKDSGRWKINAIRKFQLPKFIYTVADSLSFLPNKSEADNKLLTSIGLIIGNDENLKSYLSKNINDLYNIVDAFENEEKEELKLLMDKLCLDYIYADVNYPGCVFVQISRFERIEAGFIYTSNAAGLPKISPERFILVEEVLPNWFIYRAM